MNIINQLSLKSMRRNKTTTFVTIIGIIMSLSLMTGLFLFSNSLLGFLRDDQIYRLGDAQIVRNEISRHDLEQMPRRDMIEKETRLSILGAEQLDNNQFSYIALLGIQSDDMQQSVPLRPTAGRLPEKSGEVLISNSVNKYRETPLQIGDTVKLDISQPEHFYIHDPGEYSSSTPMEVTVVGTVNNPMRYPMNGPTIFMYQTPQEIASADRYWVGFRVKDISTERIEQFTKGWEGGWGTTTLASYYPAVKSSLYFYVKGFAMVLLIIVAVAGIGLIQNGFLISLSQRMKELAVLSSVGMTRRQKWRMAVTEGLVMYLIALPIGMASGFLAMMVVFKVLNPMMQRMIQTEAVLQVVWDVPTLVQIAAAGFVTVMIATIMPALRSSHTTVMAGVRQQQDIKLKAKDLRSPALIHKLFGMEGDLAWKNIKRNKRSYRGTLISLVFSLVLYLSLASLMHYTDVGAEIQMSRWNQDITVTNHSNRVEEFQQRPSLEKLLQLDGVEGGFCSYRMTAENKAQADNLSPKMLDLNGNEIIRVGVTSFDEENLDALLKTWGLSHEDLSGGKAVMLNSFRYRDEKGKYAVAPIFEQAPDQLQLDLMTSDGAEALDNVTVVKVINEPPSFFDAWRPELTLFVLPETLEDILTQNPNSYIASSAQLQTDRTKHEKVLEAVSEWTNSSEFGGEFADNRASQQGSRDFISIAKILFFGFATVIALMSLSNIYNSLISSLRYRRQEFAMLRSVGMEEKSFRRMIRFESYFYAFKLLIYGIPLGLLSSYAIQMYLARAVEMGLRIPVLHFSAAALTVVVVLLVIMNLGSREARRGNILDSLKTQLD